MANEYLVSGTRRRTGAIGIPDNFQIELEAPSSRDAYLTVLNGSYDGGYEHVHVIAIKMRCPQCGDCHMTVDPDLYL